MRDGRSKADTGWRRVALLLIAVLAFFWMPLGVREAAGVSSILPSLRPSIDSHPDRPSDASEVRPASGSSAKHAGPAERPIPAALPVSIWIAVLITVVAVHRWRRGRWDALRSEIPRHLGSRAPPFAL